MIIIFFLACTIDLYCQNLIGPNQIISFAARPEDVIEIDFGNDDDLDILFYSDHHKKYLWLEYENGIYYPYRDMEVLNVTSNQKYLLAADFNGNSQIELLIKEQIDSQSNYGIYSIVNNDLILQNSWTNNGAQTPRLFDVNLDGYLDIVYRASGSNIFWQENLLNYQFDSPTLLNLQAPIYEYGLADIDSDGDIDIVSSAWDAYYGYYYTSWGGHTALHLNDGNFNFSHEVINNEIAINNMKFVDLDADGDLDIVAKEYSYYLETDLLLIENDSMDFQFYQQPWSWNDDFVIHNLDGEDPLDILVFKSYAGGLKVVGILNDENPQMADTIQLGFFQGSQYFGDLGENVYQQNSFVFSHRLRSNLFKVQYELDDQQISAEIISKKLDVLNGLQQADLDNDGLSDIYINTEDGLFELRNLGDGEWDIIKKVWDGEGLSPFIFGYINEDGKLDLVTKSMNGNQLLWYKNEGDHFNSAGTPITELHQQITAFNMDDINGDGHVDIVYIALDNDLSSLYILMGQGTSDFVQTVQTNPLYTLPNEILIDNLDNSLGKDIVSLKYETALRVYSIDNDGHIINEIELSTPAPVVDVIVADLDNDGFNDIIYSTDANSQGMIYYARNLGNNQFSSPETIFYEDDMIFNYLKNVDIDGNGHQDLVFLKNTNPWDWDGEIEIRTIMNNGNFTFDSQMLDYFPFGTSEYYTFIEALDIAGDSLPEILIGSARTNPGVWSGLSNFDWFSSIYIVSNISQDFIQENEVQLMPNPVTNISTLDLGDLNGVRNISILDSRGKLVRDIGEPLSTTVQISKGELTPGLYFIRIETDARLLALKFIIE